MPRKSNPDRDAVTTKSQIDHWCSPRCTLSYKVFELTAARLRGDEVCTLQQLEVTHLRFMEEISSLVATSNRSWLIYTNCLCLLLDFETRKSDDRPPDFHSLPSKGLQRTRNQPFDQYELLNSSPSNTGFNFWKSRGKWILYILNLHKFTWIYDMLLLWRPTFSCLLLPRCRRLQDLAAWP
jgi:hypothetical protein